MRFSVIADEKFSSPDAYRLLSMALFAFGGKYCDIFTWHERALRKDWNRVSGKWMASGNIKGRVDLVEILTE